MGVSGCLTMNLDCLTLTLFSILLLRWDLVRRRRLSGSGQCRQTFFKRLAYLGGKRSIECSTFTSPAMVLLFLMLLSARLNHCTGVDLDEAMPGGREVPVRSQSVQRKCRI